MAPTAAVLHGRRRPFKQIKTGADKTVDEVRYILIPCVCIETLGCVRSQLTNVTDNASRSYIIIIQNNSVVIFNNNNNKEKH